MLHMEPGQGIIGFDKEFLKIPEVPPVSTQAIREYLEHLWKQYKKANKVMRGEILNELCRNLGLHRKSATRLMTRKYAPRSQQGFKGGRRKKFSGQAKMHLERLWKAMGYMWPQRMKAALPEWLKFDDHRDCDETIKAELLTMSASTIGRLLSEQRAALQRRMNSGTYRGVRKYITQVPIRNFSETISAPGYCEVDCVAHCGGSLSGSFAWTVNFTDLLTGWTECEAIWAKNGAEVKRALLLIEKRLPFPIKALYFDNGCEFMNDEIIEKFAKNNRKDPIEIFRSRPYKKNDQAHIEQKNYTHVRQLMGYSRIYWVGSIAQMNDIYRKEWRILQNYYMPQQKLESKIRIGAKIKRKMGVAKTPIDRLLSLLNPKEGGALLLEKAKSNPFKCRNNQRIKVRKLFSYYKNELEKNEWGKMAV